MAHRTALLPWKVALLSPASQHRMLQTGQSRGFSIALPFAAVNPKIYPETLVTSKCTELTTRAEVLGDVVAVFLQGIKKQ